MPLYVPPFYLARLSPQKSRAVNPPPWSSRVVRSARWPAFQDGISPVPRGRGRAGRHVPEFAGPGFRLYTNSDVLGVELAGAMKNVIAIAAGVCGGLGLGSNSLAALITRGLADMSRLAIKLGAKTETLRGLACPGDVVLT